MKDETQKTSRRKLKFGHYYMILFSLLIIFGAINGFIVDNRIENDGTTIVAKFIRKESLPKTTHFYFGYYHAEKYYETTASGIKHSMFDSKEETRLINDLKLNHLYTAKFNPNYLKRIIVNPSKEILDSAAIKKAGF